MVHEGRGEILKPFYPYEGTLRENEALIVVKDFF